MVCLCICFPPTANVLTATRGKVPIGDLKRSDRLITAKRNPNGQILLKETPFMSYIHFDPNLEAEFLTLECDNNAELIISKNHLLFKVQPDGKWKCVSADSIQVGDRLIHVEEGQRQFSFPKVTGIKEEFIKGVYAPLTREGTLIVDNLYVSSYAFVKSHEIAHATFAPLRMWSQLNRNLSKDKNELKKKGPQGIHKYAKAWMSFSEILPRKITPGLRN